MMAVRDVRDGPATIPMTPLAQFSQQLAPLICAVGSDDFPRLLVALLRGLVPVDDATIVAYPDTDLPLIDYFEVPDSAGGSTLDLFVKGAFLLDPFYLAATRDRRFGIFRLRDLAPAGFRDSEYFRAWYRNCGYKDECGYLIPTGGEGFVNIALGRTTSRSPFTRRQVELLQSIYPTVEVLCRRHWGSSVAAPAAVNLRGQLHSALEAFGSSLLTEREAQVINLVLHGHSTRTVAERLSISVETVKLHRKHAYAKLEVTSQAELFYLFIDSLMSSEGYRGGDTLVAYHQPARR
jgi:DNA-binding CsgD family transcriptional regulator